VVGDAQVPVQSLQSRVQRWHLPGFGAAALHAHPRIHGKQSNAIIVDPQNNKRRVRQRTERATQMKWQRCGQEAPTRGEQKRDIGAQCRLEMGVGL
jgi:hypothetical protein